jgi:hypothetical protein
VPRRRSYLKKEGHKVKSKEKKSDLKKIGKIYKLCSMIKVRIIEKV